MFPTTTRSEQTKITSFGQSSLLKKHPSPNSGYGESAVAALLGIQLGGLNTYKGIESNRAKMGEPLIPLQAGHIEQAVFIMKRTVYATWLLYFLLGGVISAITYTWS